MNLVEEHDVDLLSARSNKEDRGKAASLTDEEVVPYSNEEEDGCYGETTKEDKLLLPNTSDSEKNTIIEMIGQDRDSPLLPLNNKYSLLFNVMSSAHDKIINSQLLGLGQAQMNITKRQLLGSGQAQTKHENQVFLGSGQT